MSTYEIKWCNIQGFLHNQDKQPMCCLWSTQFLAIVTPACIEIPEIFSWPNQLIIASGGLIIWSNLTTMSSILFNIYQPFQDTSNDIFIMELAHAIRATCVHPESISLAWSLNFCESWDSVTVTTVTTGIQCGSFITRLIFSQILITCCEFEIWR